MKIKGGGCAGLCQGFNPNESKCQCYGCQTPCVGGRRACGRRDKHGGCGGCDVPPPDDCPGPNYNKCDVNYIMMNFEEPNRKPRWFRTTEINGKYIQASEDFQADNTEASGMVIIGHPHNIIIWDSVVYTTENLKEEVINNKLCFKSAIFKTYDGHKINITPSAKPPSMCDKGKFIFQTKNDIDFDQYTIAEITDNDEIAALSPDLTAAIIISYNRNGGNAKIRLVPSSGNTTTLYLKLYGVQTYNVNGFDTFCFTRAEVDIEKTDSKYIPTYKDFTFTVSTTQLIGTPVECNTTCAPEDYSISSRYKNGAIYTYRITKNEKCIITAANRDGTGIYIEIDLHKQTVRYPDYTFSDAKFEGIKINQVGKSCFIEAVRYNNGNVQTLTCVKSTDDTVVDPVVEKIATISKNNESSEASKNIKETNIKIKETCGKNGNSILNN